MKNFSSPKMPLTPIRLLLPEFFPQSDVFQAPIPTTSSSAPQVSTMPASSPSDYSSSNRESTIPHFSDDHSTTSLSATRQPSPPSSHETPHERQGSIPAPSPNTSRTPSIIHLLPSDNHAVPLYTTGKSARRQKTYACSFEGCKTVVTRPSALKAHERTHTGEKPELCSICGKRFGNRSNAARHERSCRFTNAEPEPSLHETGTGGASLTNDDWRPGPTLHLANVFAPAPSSSKGSSSRRAKETGQFSTFRLNLQ